MAALMNYCFVLSEHTLYLVPVFSCHFSIVLPWRIACIRPSTQDAFVQGLYMTFSIFAMHGFHVLLPYIVPFMLAPSRSPRIQHKMPCIFLPFVTLPNGTKYILNHSYCLHDQDIIISVVYIPHSWVSASCQQKGCLLRFMSYAYFTGTN